MVYICIRSIPIYVINHIEHISNLLSRNNYPDATEIVELPSSGSNRIYFRLTFKHTGSLLAAYNPDVSENIAWHSYSFHFREKGFHVPEIYARDEDYRYFLIQDLGTSDLFSLTGQGIDNKVEGIYKVVLRDLLRFQIEGIKGLDLDVAYPVKSFDGNSVLWDLNYFKYYFVKPHELFFNESKLENDFQSFAGKLLETDRTYFMYRDFQARNILLHQNKPWYIDFQGGREGPLMYDVVSLLYQAKANLGDELRKRLLDFYLQELEKLAPGESRKFMTYYEYFIYFRLMQVLGAYGFRGLIQRKGHFLSSIPYAINNLIQLLGDHSLKNEFPELHSVFEQIISLGQYKVKKQSENKLTITINSFSYKKQGYPLDYTENGGGFVFDCRALPNPGRIPELRDFTGRENPIIEFLESKAEVRSFFTNISAIVNQSVDNYLERGFDNLQLNFGCTGGKHRSVYNAELMAKHLQKYSDRISVQLNHIQLDD